MDEEIYVTINGREFALCPDEKGRLVIPYGATKVETIDPNYNTTLREITIPKTVEEIYVSGCKKLNKITIGTKVIPYNAFSDCGPNDIELVLEEGVEVIESSAFQCSLGPVIFPESLKSVALDFCEFGAVSVEFKNKNGIVNIDVSDYLRSDDMSINFDKSSWLEILRHCPEVCKLMPEEYLNDEKFVLACKRTIIEGMEKQRLANGYQGEMAKQEAIKNIKIMHSFEEMLFEQKQRNEFDEFMMSQDEEEKDETKYNEVEARFLK